MTKAVRLVEEVTLLGRLFQTTAPAVGNARGPAVDRRVLGTTKSAVDDDRSARRPAKTETAVNADRYAGAEP